MKSFERYFDVFCLLFKREVLRNKPLLEAKRWFKDKGDETLRLNYPLSRESVVLDLGGYLGDFAASINRKYGAIVYLFEPVTSYYEHCANRFGSNEEVHCFNFGLSENSGAFQIALGGDGSSFFRKSSAGSLQAVEVRSIVSVWNELGFSYVDLVKINIEGGEYGLLDALIESGLIGKIKYLQIQFHDFVPHAKDLRQALREKLRGTHLEMWNYDFVWESWALKLV